MLILPFRNTLMSRLLSAALVSAGACLPAAADDELEREKLARIAHELERVQAMVSEASQIAPTGQRVKFRYDWLQRDLELMRSGIVQHVDSPRQPRPVAPLRGDYRQ